MMLHLPTLSISHRQENCEHQIMKKFNQVLYILSSDFIPASVQLKKISLYMYLLLMNYSWFLQHVVTNLSYNTTNN